MKIKTYSVKVKVEECENKDAQCESEGCTV